VPPGADRLVADLDRPGDLSALGREWDALPASAGPYLCWSWLESWAAIYAPRRLAVARVHDGARVRALGLLDMSHPRRWSFAGRPVTSQRGLRCMPGYERAAWDAVGRALGPGVTLEGEGVPATAVRGEPQPWFALELPTTFGAYLAAQPRERRARLRRRRRRAPDVSVVGDGERRAALDELVRLHGARAGAKGERHDSVDERFAAMLAAVSDGVRVLALTTAAGCAGVTARLDGGGAAWWVNGGWDPAAAALSPGLVLELGSIADAIRHGLRRFDLGPGWGRHKLELGGRPVARCRAALPS
jgi:CelD/BcsL family acetyltransferase involved in cellulose biosynthesis